jgi:uncharacterized protein YbaR (Trm112 family)
VKRSIVYLTILSTALLLSSCYWITGSTGSVRLELSGFSGKGVGDRYARVWLVADKKIYPLDQDRDYVQELIPDYDEVTVTLEGIPVGPVYRVWLSIVDQEAGRFVTYVWGESGSFTISAGDEVAVTFTTQTLYNSQDRIFYPVADYNGSPTMMDKSLRDVEVFSNVVYTTDGARLYKIVEFDFANPLFSSLLLDTITAPGNQTINSVSSGIDDSTSPSPVVDTNTSIVPYNGEDFDSSVSVNLGSMSVLDSDAGSYGEGKIVLFRKAVGWGGTFTDVGGSYQWKWLNRDADKILDLVVSQDGSGYGYLASTGGAFRFDGTYLEDLYSRNPNIADYMDEFKAPAPILSLALYNPEVEALLIGTENGAYEAGIKSGPEVIEKPTIVDGTQGYRIRKISADYYGGYVAYLSDAYLFVWNPDLMELLKIPLCAGLPGRITGMAWYQGSFYYLVVSGDEGLAVLEVVRPV